MIKVCAMLCLVLLFTGCGKKENEDVNFVTPSPAIQEEQVIEKVEEDLELNYCSRLIVQSDKPINIYNAVDVVSGFFNFYILQFENEEDINHAYEQYSKDKDIISVEYDISYNALLGTTEEETEEDRVEKEIGDYLIYIVAENADEIYENIINNL